VVPDSEDAEGQEDVGCEEGFVSNDLGVVSTEEVDAAPATTSPMEDIITNDEADEDAQSQPDEVQHNPHNNNSAPLSPGPVTDIMENAPREGLNSPTPNTHTPPSELLDRSPDHDTAPVAEPTVADEEEKPVEDAFFTPQRTTGLQFDVVEREPGEVRAPAPPQQRRAAPRFY
ncbi:MAG: hypothetical protein LQ349_009697, partial [Xanthoria aureola]